MRVAVIGAGSWGTTVAWLAAHNTPTMLYSRREDVATAINERNENPRYLADFKLHPDLRATSELGEVVGAADVLVMGVPTHSFRETLEQLKPDLRPWVPVLSLSKGLEQETNLRMTQVIDEVLGQHPVGVMSGPNLAKEILDGQAAATVVAMNDMTIAREMQLLFSTDRFRVYRNPDVIGCEAGGALKNVIAIASGMADGLGAGDNTRAAVITRGLAELTQLGMAMGGAAETFSGLAGMGDLLATCISTQSRNRHVGQRLGEGATIEEITKEMDQVAEGVKTVKAVMEMAKTYEVEMPIAREVYRVIYEGESAETAYAGLLNRRVGREVHRRR